jgi:hypothetical protein
MKDSDCPVHSIGGHFRHCTKEHPSKGGADSLTHQHSGSRPPALVLSPKRHAHEGKRKGGVRKRRIRGGIVNLAFRSLMWLGRRRVHGREQQASENADVAFGSLRRRPFHTRCFSFGPPLSPLPLPACFSRAVSLPGHFHYERRTMWCESGKSAFGRQKEDLHFGGCCE